MTRTLLLDLDNTLLRNDNEEFIPSLIQAFAEYVSDLIPPSDLPAIFLESTQAMILNSKPDELLFSILCRDLSIRTGIEAGLVAERIRSFYDGAYRQLKSLIRPVNGAADLVREAISRGYTLAIATNPLYPLTAIEKRLEWAGLSAEWFRPDLVATFERFHFTKPSPAFFAEVLAQLGWPEGDVIAVGDDPQNDIFPARVFEIPTFQVTDAPGSEGPNEESANGAGRLVDLLPWLDRHPDGSMTLSFSKPAALMAVLRSTPAAIDTLIRLEDTPAFSHRVAEDEWNITEVICHLRDVETEVQLPRIKNVLSDSNPLVVGKDTDEWASQRGYCFQDPKLAYREFVDCRKETLALLDSIAPDDWSRPARHTIFGPTNLLELTSIASEHDRMHINQTWRLQRDFRDSKEAPLTSEDRPADYHQKS